MRLTAGRRVREAAGRAASALGPLCRARVGGLTQPTGQPTQPRAAGPPQPPAQEQCTTSTTAQARSAAAVLPQQGGSSSITSGSGGGGGGGGGSAHVYSGSWRTFVKLLAIRILLEDLKYIL